MLAMFSGEAKPLMDEARAAANRARANRQAEAAAGRRTRFCPPPTGKTQLSNQELMACSAPSRRRNARALT
jgi:hypothetical protein